VDDLTERLRRKAQNEQTSLDLAELLRIDCIEIDRLRRELAEALAANETTQRMWDECERELAEARRDAARYRWLRDSEPEVVDAALMDREPGEWDAAIDAAIAPERSPAPPPQP